MSVTDSQSQASKTSTAIASINILKTTDARAILPLLNFLHVKAPAIVVQAGFVVEVLQLLGLAVNPAKWAWGSVLRGVGIPLYFLSIPIWDSAFEIAAPHAEGSAAVWVVAALLLFTGLALMYVAYAISEQLSRRGGLWCQVMVNCVGGVLFQPIVHSLLAFVACDANGQLSDFPQTACWSSGAYQIVVFCVALVALVLTCICRFTCTTFFFDDLPRSVHLGARSLTWVEYMFDGLVFIACVLYHFLPAAGQRQVFAALLCAGCAIVAGAHCVALPFFHQQANQFRVVALLLISYIALVATILLELGSVHAVPADDGNNWDAVIVGGGGIFVALLGLAAADFRVSRLCLDDLRRAAEGRPNRSDAGVFPAHLPRDERLRHREMEAVILGEANFAVNQAKAHGDTLLERKLQERAALWVGHPYIETVYFASDVAVSTRFLHLFTVKTGLQPPSAMLGFAIRIFSKGLACFPFDLLLELEFATMIASFCPGKTQAAMYMLEKLIRHERSVPIAFRVFKRGNDIASSMLIRDSSHRKVFHAAQKMHKDALQHMVMFWNKLLADSVNIVQLGQLAKLITEKREEGYIFFERVVAEGTDANSMIRFAQFLEQVMMDHEAADVVRENVLDSLEAEQLGSGNAGAKTTGVHERDGKPGGQSSIFTAGRSHIGSERSQTIKNLSRNINLVFTILFLIVVALFVFGYVHGEERLRDIRTLHFAGESRGLVQETISLTSRLARVVDTASAVKLHDALAARLTDFRDHHSELSKGLYKPDSAPVKYLFALPRWSMRSGRTHETTGLLQLGNAMIASLESVVSADPTDVGTTRAAAVRFLQQNALLSAATAFNYSLSAYESDANENLQAGEYTMIGLYVLSIIVILVVYYVLVLNFHRITASKMSTLNLFTLIPKSALEKLHTESAKRLTDFDAPDDRFQRMKVARGLEDDADAMRLVMAEVAADDEESDRSSATAHINARSKHLVGMPLQQQQQHQQQLRAASGHHDDDDDGGGEGDIAEIMPTKFAAMVKNAEVADVGKVKHHYHDNYETPYSKDQFRSVVQHDAEDKKMIEERIDEELRVIRSHVRGIEAGDTRSKATGKGAAGEGDEDEESTQKSIELVERFTTAVVWLLVLLILASGALFVTVLFSQRQAAGFLDGYLAADDAFREITGAFRDVAARGHAVEAFVGAQTEERYQHYITLLQSRQSEKAIETLSKWVPLEYLRFLYTAQDAIIHAEHHQLTAARLVCSAQGFRCPDVDGVSWTTTDFDTLAFMRPISIRPLGTVGDLARPFEEQLVLAREIVGSDLHRQVRDRVNYNLNELMKAILRHEREDVNQEQQANRNFVPVHVALAALALLLALALAFSVMRVPQFESMSLLAAALLAACLAATVVGLAAPRYRANHVTDVATQMLEFRQRSNTTHYLFTAPMTLATRAFVYADELALLSLDRFLHTNALDEEFSYMVQNIDGSLFAAFTRLSEPVRTLTFIARIIASISAAHWGLYEPPAMRQTLWNFTNELNHQRLLLMFPNASFYSDRVTDLSLPPEQRMNLLAALAYGPYTQMLNSEVADGFAAIAEAHMQSRRDDLKTAQAHDNEKLMIAAVLVGIMVVVESAMVVALLLSSIRNADQSSRSAHSSTSASRQDDALFVRLTRNSQMALGFMALLFSVVFIIMIVDLEGSKTKARDQSSASLRQFEMLRTIIASDQGINGLRFNQLIREGADAVMHATDNFYFGSAGSDTVIANVGKHGRLDDMLFGAEASFNNRFSCSDPGAEADAGAEPSPLGNATALLAALAAGVDIAMRSWAREALWLTYASRVDVASLLPERLRVLEGDTDAIVEGLKRTTQEFTDILEAQTNTSRVAFLLVLSATALVLLFQFVYVFRPMISQLLHEEEGTKVMLKMIPPDVRDSIPAIAEYLETGVVLQDRKMQEINEAASDLSPIPTITIDFRGIIQNFSRAAEDAFLWSKDEAVGQNITIIQPENIAVEHDQYLARYRQTGVRKIIGKARKVRAMRRDGSLFPAEIFVKEIRVDGVTTFVGALKNITVEMEFERATALSKAVSEAATVPIVVINSRGVIVRFNSAAEDTFGYSQDIIGTNIKVLMPAADAEMHDQFLETYMRTRVKNIIDTQRRVRAKKASGELFPARISVRELRRGNDSVFIGYIEDITKAVHLQMASMVSDAIAATSPVPLVSIDDVGTIISWSPAAEKVFRLTALEAIGKNIKIIQPAAIAAKHDSYLKAYLNTGRKKMIDAVTHTKARRRDADGTYETFSIRIAVKDIVRSGKPVNFFAFIQDISAEQQLETEYKISANIRQHSTIPLITINNMGIVQTFSEAATLAFGYEESEVVGQNVKMLMPSEIATQHDEILKRYRETGIKNIIGSTRRVHALNKNGRKIPMEISVHEVIIGGAQTFVGYLRDVMAEFRMVEQNGINDAISQLAVVPLISISATGTILTCSESTCTKFLWSQDELIGQNVKVLMPDSTASRHDDYLSGYISRLQEVGEARARQSSSVLHKERRVMAKMRDDTIFPVEIHVRELLIEGMDPMFVGYVRDITEDLEKATQRHIAEVIIETSTIPLVCIDRLGTVTVFSQAAEKVFGWKRHEMTGSNVKMLMPEAVAKMHDGYLRAYTKTGIKTIIDSKRQVIAVRKTGEHFSAEIMVKENIHVDASGVEISEYIGFIRDLTQQYILQQANMINEVVAQLSMVPIIVITSRGMVIDFNKAAERDFGFMHDEVIQKNIKMLMPEEVAVKHDGYLQRYRLTGKKAIIDNTRAVVAKRKNGQLFHCEISVKEVKKEGAEPQYLGYVRDLTMQREMEAQYEMNTAIGKLSAIPLLVIDERGIVQMFNRAAESAFGYAAKDVVGQNIKMLMPEDIAAHHDTFLERYLVTGVKNVIDSLRRVNGKRHNGSLVPLELNVKEIILEDKTRLYIGYARVITEEARMAVEMSFNESVNSMSPIPIIAINHHGVISRFSAAAEAEFGVKAMDIIGKNITTLQTEDVASRHDQYLARYLETGVKRVVDRQRQVIAKRLDGTTFPAELAIKEVRDGNNPEAPPSFVGYVRNISEDVKIVESSKEGNAMIQLSPIPIVVINPRGTILDANPATLHKFRFEADDLVGANVKVLMPENVAIHHDSFLKRYIQTGKKTVIDSTRRVVGKRRDGTCFEAELSVRELVVSGAERRFIGYIRDCSEELRVRSSLEINDAVSELITTPIVAIDRVGKIIKFSASAEQLFGYEQAQVVGKNVKMLLPKTVAQFHDGYLQRYQETRQKTIVDSTRRVQAMHSDGHMMNVEIGVREVLKKDGSTLMFIGYIRPLARVFNVGQSAEVNKIMIDLAGQAIVIISDTGVIERINDTVRQLFKVPENVELVGKNVKCLMPESVASQHDFYLQRYQRERQKAVIDSTRDVIAREVSTGREFPVEISVKEILENGKPPRYLGYIRPREKDIALDMVKRSSEVALNLSPYATIVIDVNGVILMASRSACVMFGLDDPREILQENIKVLMPEDVASQHDGFLEAYRRTGEKHVIDQHRAVTARNYRSGTHFPVTLMVKEIKFKDQALESVFVGFIDAP